MNLFFLRVIGKFQRRPVSGCQTKSVIARAFSQLISDSQFANVGLVLLAELARAHLALREIRNIGTTLVTGDLRTVSWSDDSRSTFLDQNEELGEVVRRSTSSVSAQTSDTLFHDTSNGIDKVVKMTQGHGLRPQASKPNRKSKTSQNSIDKIFTVVN